MEYFKEMKLLLTVLAFIVVIITAYPLSVPVRGAIEDRANVIITRDKLIIESVFPGHRFKNQVFIANGINTGYYILEERLVLKYEIIKYK